MEAGERQALVDVLNRILAAEYGVLWLLPRHLAQLPEGEMKRQLRLIGEVELEHAEKSAQMIYSLGAEPKEDLPSLRPRKDLREILEAHLEGERQAIVLYGEAMGAAPDPAMRGQLEQMRGEEEGHQRLLQRLLSLLTESGG